MLPDHLTVPILKMPISRMSLSETARSIRARIDSGRGGSIFFVNVHVLTESTRNPALEQALSQAALRAADGVPLLWVARLKGQPISQRVCGPDFMDSFLKTERDLLHGLIGGAPGVAERISSDFGLQATCYSPPLRDFSMENAREDWERFLSLRPGESPPSVVWVGLGAPKQELWIEAIRPLAPATVFLGVGAAFDFLARTKARAPAWMQRSGLEWLYRLGSEPGRLFSRYLSTHTRFLWLALRDLL